MRVYKNVLCWLSISRALSSHVCGWLCLSIITYEWLINCLSKIRAKCLKPHLHAEICNHIRFYIHYRKYFIPCRYQHKFVSKWHLLKYAFKQQCNYRLFKLSNLQSTIKAKTQRKSISFSKPFQLIQILLLFN